MNKEYKIRTKEQLYGTEGGKFQNGRFRRYTKLWCKALFLFYVLSENSWSIKTDYRYVSSIVDEYDFQVLYFNQGRYEIFSAESPIQRKYKL